MRPCLEPGCPTLVYQGRCPRHARTSPRNHYGVSRQRRGYGRAYEVTRAELIGQPCELRLPGCTGIADSADHYEGGLRPACQHCNYARGAKQRQPLIPRVVRVGGGGEILETRSGAGPHSSHFSTYKASIRPRVA